MIITFINLFSTPCRKYIRSIATCMIVSICLLMLVFPSFSNTYTHPLWLSLSVPYAYTNKQTHTNVHTHYVSHTHTLFHSLVNTTERLIFATYIYWAQCLRSENVICVNKKCGCLLLLFSWFCFVVFLRCLPVNYFFFSSFFYNAFAMIASSAILVK